ncbi:hypothetical protein ACFS5J_07190 [Flavobacterium chuncheonense]|uniref:Carboxypeptidase-like regulatory domain-containing protein n=1 Tax=Flavobacterium chuncheonense TaxID=2026653 RepID=A0ABW5YMH2_9FLAO
MRQNYLFATVLLLILTQWTFAQGKERVVLVGKILSDSLDVENISVFNISSNTTSITNIDGKFSIKARETDTLFFQSLAFVSKKYVLTQNDFWVDDLEIRLDVKINELDEVVVSPSTLTGILKEDTKKIKVYGLNMSSIDVGEKRQYSDSRFDRTPNSVMPSQFAPNGSSIDIKMILVGVAGLLGIKGDPKRNSRKVYESRWKNEVTSMSFSDHLYRRFSHNFFVNNLKLKNEEIATFIAFAEPGVDQLAQFLKPENELQFVEYLLQKVEEFKRNKSTENTTNTNQD